jgi:hypothetical protein
MPLPETEQLLDRFTHWAEMAAGAQVLAMQEGVTV